VEPPGGYWDYESPWDYAQGLGNVVESISEVLKEGFAAEAIELSEYALAAIEEKAMDYDVDGTVYGVLEVLEEIHHAPAWRRSRTRKRWQPGSFLGSCAGITMRSTGW
jgi:hypothetical protein